LHPVLGRRGATFWGWTRETTVVRGGARRDVAARRLHGRHRRRRR